MMDEAQKIEPGELERCQKERDEYLNGWKRAKADLINFQKDEAKRLEATLTFGLVAAFSELLPVLDSFEQARAQASDSGLGRIEEQLREVLKRRGIETIPVAAGDAFDSLVHEAVGEVKLIPDKKTGTVAAVVLSGYTYNGKVIRATKVKIYG